MSNTHDMSNLHALPAREAVLRLARGEVSPLELVEAAAARIAAVEPHLNALPTLCLDRARAHARRIMAAGPRAPARGWLGGLPVAIKDLSPVAGVRTTFGSRIHADYVPVRSGLLVERLESNGAIVIGKSNTPEFGAGASTFNEVLGKTRNPWNTAKSVAGSSGGAAAAVASGEVWLAQGSDLGGSLRTPASFNSVVGLRPSPGRVPHGPSTLPFDTLAVDGPIARNAADVALFLDAMAGEHPEDPLSLAAPDRAFVDWVDSPVMPARIAFSPDLGIVPVDAEVIAVCTAAAQALAGLGAEITDTCPDFSEAIDCFQTLRALRFAADHEADLAAHRALLKPEIVWNIEKGMALGAAEIGAAERARGRLHQRMAEFFRDHDLLLCPAAIVAPFDVDIRYIEEVNGQRFDDYVHWISITFAITLTGCPAVSVAAGFTREGLPVGLQIVGPPHAEGRVLAAAALLEQVNGIAARLPIDPRGPGVRSAGRGP